MGVTAMNIQDFFSVNSLNKLIYIWLYGELTPLTKGKFSNLPDNQTFTVNGSSKEWMKVKDSILPV